MSLLHFSHDHPLILREVDTNGGHDMLCHGCHKPIVPLLTSLAIPNDAYICGDATCDAAFYLHKKCAQLSKQIQHPMHDRHPLTLQARPPYTCGNSSKCVCSICNREWGWFTYSCLRCQFDVCMTCLFENRSLQHAGHAQHTLSLMQREALLHCDACGTEAKDSSYVCNECEFWMHKTCAFTPTTLEAGGFHRHPLVLLYSLPDIHRTFYEFCRICKKTMHTNRWLYYCDKCTYFVHIKCIATTTTSGEGEPQEDIDEHDLLRFPVHSKESFIDLITEQFAKRNINFKKGIAASESCTGAGINHWSHKDHPLTLLEELVQSEVEIICNGCIQTITTSSSHPYYGCIKCNFFLHAFCLDLPLELPAGACSHHPEHPLVLRRTSQIFFGVKCNACELVTNGFYYSCGKCNIMFDIRCCFLPIRIKHQSHNHPLLHSASSDSNCDACDSRLAVNKLFKCERNCSSGFQIHKSCALLPGTMRHSWDPHPIQLIYPPFDHQGQVYCEICEDEINTNLWLYHCSECDHSFHTYCLRRRINFKVGDYELVPGLHRHKLTLIDKKKHEHHRPFLCSSCNMNFGNYRSVFECVNCDVLFCVKCVSSHL